MKKQEVDVATTTTKADYQMSRSCNRYQWRPPFPQKKKSREKRYFSFSLSLSLPFQPFDTLVAVTISAKSPVPYQVSALLAPVSLKGQLWG